MKAWPVTGGRLMPGLTLALPVAMSAQVLPDHSGAPARPMAILISLAFRLPSDASDDRLRISDRRIVRHLGAAGFVSGREGHLTCLPEAPLPSCRACPT
jgi:hypothetical protein